MLKVIYEDKDKLIVDKRAGQLSQSGKSVDVDLVSEVLAYRKKKKEEVYAAIINRLDRPVAGLVLFAKNKEAAARYSREVQDKGSISKIYEAYVYGKVDCKKETLVDYLIHDKVNNTSSIYDMTQSMQDNEDLKEARLEYELLSYDEESKVSRIRIKLMTGRHHQIRVQFASRGHAILGDYKYLEIANQFLRDRNEKNISMEEFDMLTKKYRLRRNTIALAAVELEVDGQKFTRSK